MMFLRRSKGPPHVLRLVALLAVIALLAAACNSDDDGSTDNGSAAEDGTGTTAENGADPEESPEPKTEEELTEIEEGDPIEKQACTARERLRAKKGRAVIQLSVSDDGFSPQCPVGASLNNVIEFEITNDGERLHNFSAPARGLDVDLQPGETRTIQMAMGNEKIPFFCKYHADQGMRGAVFPGKPPGAKKPGQNAGGGGGGGGGDGGSENDDDGND